MTEIVQLPQVIDLTFKRGDDFTVAMRFYERDPDGETTITIGDEEVAVTLLDVSDWEITGHARRSPNATTFEAFDVGMDDAADGVVRFTLTAEQTAGMPNVGGYDWQRVVDGVTRTFVEGVITDDPDYTRDEGS